MALASSAQLFRLYSRLAAVIHVEEALSSSYVMFMVVDRLCRMLEHSQTVYHNYRIYLGYPYNVAPMLSSVALLVSSDPSLQTYARAEASSMISLVHRHSRFCKIHTWRNVLSHLALDMNPIHLKSMPGSALHNHVAFSQ